MAINPNNPYASFGSNQFSPIARPPRDESLRKLMDPTGFLSELAKLKEPTAGPMPTGKKKTPKQAAVMQPPPASTTPPSTTTPPASTTPTTPAAPAPTPRTNPPVYRNTGSVSDTMWKDQSDAAKLTFAQDPLAANSGNNLRRELGRIAAEESFARRDAESRDRYRQANDRHREMNLYRESLRASQPKPAYTTQTAPAVKPVSLPMGTPPQMDFGNGAAPNPLVVTPDVPKLVQSTPTGQLSSLAGHNYNEPQPWRVGPPAPATQAETDSQKEAMRRAIAARDQQMAFTNPGTPTMPTMDPLTAKAMADEDRYRADRNFNILPGVDSTPDMKDPVVFKNYMEAVENRRRQMAGAGAQEVGAPRKLDSGGQPTVTETAINTALAPFAPNIPQELRDKQIATAQSVGERDAAQAAQYQDQTRDSLWMLLGGGAMADEAAKANPDITNPRDPMLLERSRYRKAPTDLSPRQPGPTDLVAPDWRGPNAPLPPEQPIVTPANQGNSPLALPQGTSGGAYPLPPTALESLAMSSSEPIIPFQPSANPIGSPRNPADYRPSEINLGKRGQTAVRQHMIENPDAGKGIGVQQRRATPAVPAPDLSTSTVEMSPAGRAAILEHMIENPNAGSGIGVNQRRQGPAGRIPPTSPPRWVPSASEPLPPVPPEVRRQNAVRQGLLNPPQTFADFLDYLAGSEYRRQR